jgi:hypothetical protein
MCPAALWPARRAVAGLVVAFVVVPPRLAASGPAADLADHGRFLTAVRVAVVEYWQSGVRDHPPALQRVLDYWVRFHLVKGGIAALLLIAFGALSVVLWRTFLRAEGLGTGKQGRSRLGRHRRADAGVVRAGGRDGQHPGGDGAVRLAVPMLTESPPDGTADPDVAATLCPGQAATGRRAPDRWLHPARPRRHGQRLRLVPRGAGRDRRRRRGRPPRPQRDVLASRRQGGVDKPTDPAGMGWFGAFSAVSALIMVVLLVANAGTATDPAPALLALFNGGF